MTEQTPDGASFGWPGAPGVSEDTVAEFRRVDSEGIDPDADYLDTLARLRAQSPQTARERLRALLRAAEADDGITAHDIVVAGLEASKEQLIEAYEDHARTHPNEDLGPLNIARLMASDAIAEAHVARRGPDPARHGTDEYAAARAVRKLQTGYFALLKGGTLPEPARYDAMAGDITLHLPDAESTLGAVMADPAYGELAHDDLAGHLAFVLANFGNPETTANPAP